MSEHTEYKTEDVIIIATAILYFIIERTIIIKLFCVQPYIPVTLYADFLGKVLSSSNGECFLVADATDAKATNRTHNATAVRLRTDIVSSELLAMILLLSII